MQQVIPSEQSAIDRARELGRALGASKAFRDYERALEQYQGDPSAADLLEQMRRVQQEASMQEMLWGNSRSDWAERLASLQQQVRAHPAIRALQQAEVELVDLVFGVVLRLGDVTGIDYAEACTGRSLSGCGPVRPRDKFTTALRSSPEIAAAVETLGRSIHETQAFHEFAIAKKAFQSDPEVTRLREQVKSVVSDYVEAEKKGSVTLEGIEKVRQFQNKLREHPVTQNFSSRRQEVHSAVQAINQALAEALGIDIAQIVAPASGCCG